MRRIAHGKGPSHGEGVHFVSHACQRGLQCLQIQRHAGVAIVVVPSSHRLNWHAREGLGDTGARDHGWVKTDQHHADGTAMTFHHRIGGQGGRYRHQRDILRLQALRQQADSPGDRLSNANSQVTLGRDGLGRRNDAVTGSVNDGRVCVGATGVHPHQVGRRRGLITCVNGHGGLFGDEMGPIIASCHVLIQTCDSLMLSLTRQAKKKAPAP